MNKSILLSLSLLLPFLTQPAAFAQGAGVVEGKLIDKTDPGIVASNVDLDVLAFAGGLGIIKSATTDSAGKFRIEGLPTDQMLLVRANYKGANYIERVNFDASGKAEMEIDIYETTTSTRDIRAQGVRLAFELTPDHLQSLETVSFDNQTKPPKTLMDMKGNFHFSKAPGILEPPSMSVTGPGSPMPLRQSPLESADGQSYYSLYPLRPGVTTFEIQESLPYTNHTYTYRKKFYQDIDSIQIGVMPQDMAVSGDGLTKVTADPQKNFAVYTAGPIKAGAEVTWSFSGGSPIVEAAAAPAQNTGESRVKPFPNDIGQNALVIGPLMLMGMIVVLWYSFNQIQARAPSTDLRMKQLRERREQLLNSLANLDIQYESQGLERRDYVRQREQGKRQLRRISLLLKK